MVHQCMQEGHRAVVWRHPQLTFFKDNLVRTYSHTRMCMLPQKLSRCSTHVSGGRLDKATITLRVQHIVLHQRAALAQQYRASCVCHTQACRMQCCTSPEYVRSRRWDEVHGCSFRVCRLPPLSAVVTDVYQLHA